MLHLKTAGSHLQELTLNSGTNLLFSPPGLLGRASISIGAQEEAATGATTGAEDQALLPGGACSRTEPGAMSGETQDWKVARMWLKGNKNHTAAISPPVNIIVLVNKAL